MGSGFRVWGFDQGLERGGERERERERGREGERGRKRTRKKERGGEGGRETRPSERTAALYKAIIMRGGTISSARPDNSKMGLEMLPMMDSVSHCVVTSLGLWV